MNFLTSSIDPGTCVSLRTVRTLTQYLGGARKIIDNCLCFIKERTDMDVKVDPSWVNKNTRILYGSGSVHKSDPTVRSNLEVNQACL